MLVSAACSNGSNSASNTTGPSAINSIARPDSTSTPPTPIFDRTGGCNEAVFWAVNADETVALRISTTVPEDRSTSRFDLTNPDGPTVELQRGASLRMLLCGDTSDETYSVTSTALATLGTITFSFGAAQAGSCGYEGSAGLNEVTFSDGTRIDSLEITSTVIGCYAN